MTVLNKYKDKIPEGAIYIGRGSPWGNPFPITKEDSREYVINKYKEYIKQQIKVGNITLQQLADLYGKDLVCFCKPKPCHGDVIEKLAEWAYNKLHLNENK